MTDLKELSNIKCWEGHLKVFEHMSRELGSKATFSIYLPSATNTEKLPVLYYLSGLTCNHETMFTKCGIQKYAEKYKIIVVAPDTSPRGANVPGEDDAWDLGTGAGFYVDATQEPWSKNYRMYSYVTKELRSVIGKNFPCADGSNIGITGHSMGGHGALVCFLRNPQIYRAVSAFAPISNPTMSPWGQKCLGAYLGPDVSTWKEYDATELVKRQPQKSTRILVDQGSCDEYMDSLLPNNFVKTCEEVGQALTYNLRDGYNHGYYFVQTFIGEHMKMFADALHR